MTGLDRFVFDRALPVMMATVAIICVLGLPSLLGFGLYEAINWLALSEQQATAQIVEVSFQPQHREWRDGKVNAEMMVPDRWYLDIEGPVSGALAIEHAPWQWQRAGSPVTITYRKSRLSGEADIIVVAPR